MGECWHRSLCLAMGSLRKSKYRPNCTPRKAKPIGGNIALYSWSRCLTSLSTEIGLRIEIFSGQSVLISQWRKKFSGNPSSNEEAVFGNLAPTAGFPTQANNKYGSWWEVWQGFLLVSRGKCLQKWRQRTPDSAVKFLSTCVDVKFERVRSGETGRLNT